LVKLDKQSRRLLDLPAEVSRASSTEADEVLVFESGSLRIEEAVIRVPLYAGEFGRYRFGLSGKRRVIFPYHCDHGEFQLYRESDLREQYPRAFAHLLAQQAALKQRKRYAEWFGYSAPRSLALHERAQIAVPLLADRGLCALIPEAGRGRTCPMASGGFTITLGSQCPLKPEYVLGLLNSRLLFWRLRTLSNVFRGGWITCTKQYFGELPIRVLDLSKPADRLRHERMVLLVEQMLDLNRRLPTVRTPQEKIALERQIAATDTQIDQLVYDLYGLTDEEVRIVESAK